MSNQVDLEGIIDGWWGGTFDSSILAGILAGTSNIIVGGNPAYALADFLAIYPKFGSISGTTYTSLVPQAVLQMYITLASACLSYNRWLDHWPMAMALFTAHYATLYLQSEGNAGTAAGTVASSGLAKGVQVSKSVGDVSVSMESLIGEWGSWGSWNLTTYGTQLMTVAKMIGWGMMYIY